MDCHFVDANPRHSLPILLALVDLWNVSFLLTKGRVVSPYSAALGSYPGFVAALENCVLSRSGQESAPAHKTGVTTKQGPSPVIDGRDQTLSSACPQALSAEFLMAVEDGSVKFGGSGFTDGQNPIGSSAASVRGGDGGIKDAAGAVNIGSLVRLNHSPNLAPAASPLAFISAREAFGGKELGVRWIYECYLTHTNYNIRRGDAKKTGGNHSHS